MAVCNFSGDADMYGLGIRIGFYLQWYGTILAAWIAPSEVPGLRFSNSLFVTATFLALVIQTSENTLRPVEIYIVLLLTFGAYLYFVPMYIWRVIVRSDVRLDPSRHPRVLAGPVFSALNFILLVTVSIFQLWFWIKRAEDDSRLGCTEYGFLFAKIRLNSRGFVAVNIIFHLILLISCIVVLLFTIRSAARKKLARDVGERVISFVNTEEVGMSKLARTAMQEIHSAIHLLVASVVTAATELTISWNGIRNVNTINSAGQLIPMIIGIGLVTRVFYIAIWYDIDAVYRHEHEGMIAAPTEYVTRPHGAASSYSSSSSESSRR